jgi:hypothetical protein
VATVGKSPHALWSALRVTATRANMVTLCNVGRKFIPDHCTAEDARETIRGLSETHRASLFACLLQEWALRANIWDAQLRWPEAVELSMLLAGVRQAEIVQCRFIGLGGTGNAADDPPNIVEPIALSGPNIVVALIDPGPDPDIERKIQESLSMLHKARRNDQVPNVHIYRGPIWNGGGGERTTYLKDRDGGTGVARPLRLQTDQWLEELMARCERALIQVETTGKKRLDKRRYFWGTWSRRAGEELERRKQIGGQS